MKLLLCLGLCSFAVFGTAQTKRLAVHEWGTFTSLQDETGRTIGGINSDDEPVPAFVHDLDHFLIVCQQTAPPILFQGAPHCHPGVTLRLETPVIYFHRPRAASAPITVNVEVSFRGGWLTQFYPDAESDAPRAFGALTGETTGKLTWRGLNVGTQGNGPDTSEHVWLAPRAVKADAVTTEKGESEKYLFYRGVGHVQSPIQVVREEKNRKLRLQGQLDAWFKDSKPLNVARLWLAEFHPDGACAFRTFGAVALTAGSQAVLLEAPAEFDAKQFAPANLPKLRSEMRDALVADGLFADEAEALLNTWELSYFKSAGLRLFFTVPRAWTDHYLPLEISVPADLARVMVGRIELITPGHRSLLRQIADGPAPTRGWAFWPTNSTRLEGEMPAAYRDLGRFRNALILDEQKRQATKALDTFIRFNGLQGYTY